MWPGRRPSLAELGTWHEALRGAVATALPVDLLALWLHPSRGGPVLVGPRGLSSDPVIAPMADPLIGHEGLFALEDRVRAGGYASVMAVPVRDQVQDVGLLLVASFADDAYRFDDQRTLYRIAAALAPTCRRLGTYPWIVPAAETFDRTALIANVTESLLNAMSRARDGAEVVLLASDALAVQLPHDRLELVAVAPAPDCWALVGAPLPPARSHRATSDRFDSVHAIVHGLGARSLARIDDLHETEHRWPAGGDQRGAERIRSVLAARLEVGDELVGWLWIGSENRGWFKPEDEIVAHLAARILAARVAAWAARAELAGAWA